MSETGHGGLTGASVRDLEQLLAMVRDGRVSCPITTSALQFAGLGSLASALGTLEELDAVAMAALLESVLAERRQRRARVELVWTGPEGVGSASRDTAVVVRDLFGRARRSVLVGGFAFDHGERLLRPLHEAMVAHGVHARFFLDLGAMGRLPTGGNVAGEAVQRVRAFLRENWPFGEPCPEIYYDPRSLAGSEYASLHAKCIVVDGRYSLVGSANFTDRGQTRNIEAGVLIEDAAFAERLVGQWQGLVDGGLVRRAEGAPT